VNQGKELMIDSGTGVRERVAVVTGGTKGIGLAIAEALLDLRFSVVVCARQADEIAAAAKRFEKRNPGKALAVVCDVRREEDVEALMRHAVDRFGGLDILVNNAADITRGTIESVPLATWDRILAVNLRAPFILLQAAIPHLRQRGGGAVVNVGSINAYIGEPKLCPYSVSKGGLMTLTKNAAAFLNQYRIRVNQLNVGWTLTEGEHRIKLAEGKGEDWLTDAVATRPFGRLLEPADVAAAVAYFVSDAAACITGTVMDMEQYPVGAPPNW
jgi:NAD(P)-dependent dehydrogenase (short-subunit alcohol dehydrogenase family)